MLGESHSIHHEFPEHHARIDALMKDHPEFHAQVEEHDRLDKTIRGLELRESPIADQDMEAMKAERLRLKDAILRRLNHE
ncbi:MAG: YdcH family protein [Alcanivorax sp.]|nr:YdcH family protein [Alcanivorax sp.]